MAFANSMQEAFAAIENEEAFGESPTEFRLRNLFVSANALARACTTYGLAENFSAMTLLAISRKGWTSEV